MSDPNDPLPEKLPEDHPEAVADRKLAILAKGLASGVPIVGGVAAELIGAMLSEPTEQRRREWLQGLVRRVNEMHGDLHRVKAGTPDEAFLAFDFARGIYESENISSVTDEGLGKLTVMFVECMKSANIMVSDIEGRLQIRVVDSTSCSVSIEYDEQCALSGKPIRLHFRTVG